MTIGGSLGSHKVSAGRPRFLRIGNLACFSVAVQMSRFDVSGMVRQDFVDALNLAWLLCGGAGSIALEATLCESAKIVVMHSTDFPIQRSSF